MSPEVRKISEEVNKISHDNDTTIDVGDSTVVLKKIGKLKNN